jgi:hypothetical protein
MQPSKGLIRLLLAFLLTLTHIFVNAQVKKAGSENSTSIFPKGQLAPASNFTGKAWVHPLIQADSAFNIPVSSVTFEPGARTFTWRWPGNYRYRWRWLLSGKRQAHPSPSKR